MMRKYRVVPLGRAHDDEWYDDRESASRAIARWTGIAEHDMESSATRVALDPVVARRPEGRWRSTAAWKYRGPVGAVHLFDMILIDEQAYDH